MAGTALEEETLRQHYLRGERRGDAGAAERSTAFGDLYVEASINLPAGEKSGVSESTWIASYS